MSNSLKGMNVIENASLVFVGAAHLDRTGWLATSGELNRSNPGKFQDFVGGATLNTASICAAFGVSTSLLSILGKDSTAKTIKTEVQSRGINLHAQSSQNLATATYTSIVQPDGEMITALADMEIYETFQADAKLLEAIKNSAPTYLCVDANLPEAEIAEIIDNAPCPTVGLTVSAAKAPRLRNSISQLDLLFTNRAEVLALTKLGDDHSTETAVEALHQLGANRAVVSDGPNNVWILDGDEITALPVPPLSQQVDLTGAGDALAGGTLVALLGGADLSTAVQFGMKAAQEIIKTAGPYRPDLATLLNFEMKVTK